MKLSDLKINHHEIALRNGTVGTVVSVEGASEHYVLVEGHYHSLNSYNADLTHKEVSRLDMMIVQSPTQVEWSREGMSLVEAQRVLLRRAFYKGIGKPIEARDNLIKLLKLQGHAFDDSSVAIAKHMCENNGEICRGAHISELLVLSVPMSVLEDVYDYLLINGALSDSFLDTTIMTFIAIGEDLGKRLEQRFPHHASANPEYAFAKISLDDVACSSESECKAIFANANAKIQLSN